MKQIKEIRSIETNELQGYNLDGMFIPLEPSNRHYQEIKSLIGSGDAEIIPAFTEEERLEYFKKKELAKLQSLADKKTQEAKYYIAGQKVSEEQEKRYETKYNESIKAINTGIFTYFEPEAKLLGITAFELAGLVKVQGDKWQKDIAEYIKLIEAYRVKAKRIITEELKTVDECKLVEKFLDYTSTLGSVTEDDIVSLFDKFYELLNQLRNGAKLDELEIQ